LQLGQQSRQAARAFRPGGREVIDVASIAYSAGRQACADGKARGANPHHPDEVEHEAWLRGWSDEYRTLPAPLQSVRDAKESAREQGA
jgi:hypothetical protein